MMTLNNDTGKHVLCENTHMLCENNWSQDEIFNINPFCPNKVDGKKPEGYAPAC